MANQIDSLTLTEDFDHSIASFLKLLLKATKLKLASVIALRNGKVIYQKTLDVNEELTIPSAIFTSLDEGSFQFNISELGDDFTTKVKRIYSSIDTVEGIWSKLDGLSYAVLLFKDTDQEFNSDLELVGIHLNQLMNLQLDHSQKNRLESIIDSTEIGTWEWNVQSGEVSINERYAEIVGYRKDELEPININTWYQIVHPSDRDLSDNYIQECFDQKRLFYNIECRLLHKDGSVVWVNDRGKVVSWTKDGKPLIMAGSHTDITNRKLAEEREKNILNNVPGAVFRYQRFKDGSDRILMVSKKAKEVWGYSTEEVVKDNQLVWGNIHKDDLTKLLESIDRSENELSTWEYEWRYYHPVQKEYRWHNGMGNPIKQEDGSIVWDSIIRDVTNEINTKNDLKNSVWQLKERIKEQECLTEISRLCAEIKDQKDLLNQAVKALIKGIQFPEYALAEITFKGEKYSSNPNKRFTHSIEAKKKKSTGNVLQLQWGYWSKKYNEFLKEEKDLVERVVGMLVLALESQAISKEEKKSKEKYQSLINTVDGVVWEADAQTFEFLYVSSQVKDLLGYSSKEWLAEKNFWQNHIYHEDRESAIKFCHRKTHDLESHSFEYRMVKKNGNLIWVHDIVSVIKEKGEAKLLRGILVDITEKKAVENRLKTLYKDNHLILQSTEEGIYGIDNDGYCTFINPAAAEMIGYDVDECIDRNMHELIHFKTIEGENVAEVDCPIYQAKEEKKTCRVEEDVFWRKDGSSMYVRYTSTPIIDEGNVSGAVVVFNDISEQKKIKDELAQNRRRYEALVENGGDAVAILKTDGSTKYISPSIQNVLGYTVDEALNLRLEDIVHEVDYNTISRVVEIAIENPGIPQPPKIARVQHKKGHFVYTETIITSMLHDTAVAGIVDNFRDVTPRILAQQKIDASEKRFRAMVQDGSDLIAILNPDRSYQYVSPNYRKYTNLSEEELIGEKAIHFIHPDDQDRVHEEFNHLNSSKSIKTAPFRFKYKNNWRWIQSNAINLIDDEIINGIVVNSSDVTDLMETQLELKESESRYRGFYESQTNYVIRTDMEGNYSYVNKKFLEDFAWLYPDGNVVGKSCMPSICEYHHNKVIETVEKCIQNPEKVVKVEIDKPQKNGSIITTLWDFVCVLDGNGKPSEIQCMGIDITDRIQFEKKLKRNIQRFEHVNKLTNDAIYDWKVNEGYILWGKSFSRIFGHSMEVIGHTIDQWVKLIHPDDIHRVEKSLEQLLNHTKKNFWEFEYRFLKADGTYAWVLDKGFVERNEKCEPIRMTGILRDITKQKNEELQTTVERKLAAFFRRKDTLKKTINNCLKYLSILGQFEAAEVWLVSEEKKHLNQMTIYAKSKNGKSFIQNTKSINRFKKGAGIPGTVWKSEQIELWDEVGKKKSFIRHQAAMDSNIYSAIGIPLFHMDVFVGCLVFFGSEETQQYLDKVKTFSSLNNFLGAEIKRKQQEEELSLLFESSPDIMAIASTNNHFVKANPAFCKLLGYTEEEITSRPFSEFLHPDDLKKTKSEYKENISGSKAANNFTNRYQTKSGEYKWISWNSSESFNEDNFRFAYGRDVTEVKKLEKLLETATSLARLGFWEVDLEKSEVYFSKITREIHELSMNDQPTLESALIFYREDYRDEITEIVNKAINKGIEYDYEAPLITAKGNEVWVKAIGKVTKRDGKTIRFYGSIQDITERKKTEMEVLHSNERFEKVAEATNDAIWDFNAETGKSYWGKGFETLFGLTLKELNPGFEQLVKLMHPEDQKRIKKEFDDFRKNKSKTKWFAEFRLKKEDGTYAYVVDRGNFFRNKKGEIYRGVGAMTDITHRKEYEESLQELNEELKVRARELAISNADLEQFAFVASHDLQEPLRMVSSFLTQLEKKYSDQLDERAQTYIDFAVDGSKRMKQIILDILEYSRVGRHEEEEQLLDLNEVVEDVKKILKASIEERNVVLKYDKLPKLNTYAGPLLQIIQNLINNAIKYSNPERRPEIKIAAKERPKEWLISVSDNGIGIEADYYEKIFLIFQRLHSKGPYEGSGMGLAIVKKNIDKLGGEIWVDSEVGVGSTFYFTIKK